MKNKTSRVLGVGLLLAAFTCLYCGEVPAQETGGSASQHTAGTIEGTVSVVRTKVKTAGPKSDKDVVVYLEKVGDTNFPAPSKHVKVDQKGLVYIPHVSVVQKGTTVDFLNTDNDRHNVYFLYDKSGEQLDLGTWQPGETRSHKFDIVDTAILLCKLHLEMAAFVVVLDTPLFTKTSIDGETQQATYSLENVPPGTYTLNVWHKKLKLKGGSREVTVESGTTTTADLEITKAKYAK